MPDSTLPLYKEVANKLREELWQFKPGQAFYSDREVAKNHNISFLTARNAVMQLVHTGQLDRIARKGTYVSAKQTTQKKQQVIETYRFILYMPKASILSVGAYYAAIFETCKNLARQNAADLVFSSIQSPDDIDFLYSTVKDRQEKGVFLIGPVGESIGKRLKSIQGLSIVAIDHDYSNIGIDSVNWNLFETGKLAAEKLANKGHQHIAYIGQAIDQKIKDIIPELKEEKQWPNATTFLQGIKAGLKENNIQKISELSINSSIGSWQSSTEALAKKYDKPTAYICFSGEFAKTLNNTLQMQCPEDPLPDFIAWSDHPDTKSIENIITLKPSTQILAETAFQTMLNREEHPENPVTKESLLPTINLTWSNDEK